MSDITEPNIVLVSLFVNNITTNLQVQFIPNLYKIWPLTPRSPDYIFATTGSRSRRKKKQINLTKFLSLTGKIFLKKITSPSKPIYSVHSCGGPRTRTKPNTGFNPDSGFAAH